MTDPDPAAPGEAAGLFVLSFRHRDEVTAMACRGGWRPISARRAAGAERRFIASGATVALVDGRDAFEEAIGALQALADPIQANAAGLVALVARDHVARLDEVLAAGATHYLAEPFEEPELLQTLRFAARHAERVGGGVSRPAVTRAESLSWRALDGTVALSPALAERLGAAARRLSPRAAYQLLGPSDRNAARAARRRLAAGYGSTAFAHALPDGTRVAHHLSAAEGAVSGLIEPLDPGALGALPLHRDPLTGLADGHAARRWLTRTLGEGKRPGVLVLSLSRLQVVNTRYGRAGGDVLLQAAARRIEQAVQAGSGGRAWLARLTGPEFMIGLPRARIADLQALADAAVAAVERRVADAADTLLLGAHVGGVLAGANDVAGDLLRRAEGALAEAREQPGSAIRLLAPGAEHNVPRAQRLADELRGAMAAGQIDVLFQPQVRMTDGHVTGVEALARWRHPELGEVGADALFGAAERAGLCEPLSELVQSRALAIAAAWPDVLGGLQLSINVTAGDIARPRFAADMLARIAASGFDPARVTVEVTEEGLIEDLTAAAAALASLRQGGCAVAIDDFGTGYSSLAYLKALPIDCLKLDRRLSQDITGAPRDRIVVRSVIDLARSLGLGVIAEGVETEEQRALLALEGCTTYQGFLCSGPVTTDELAEIVAAPR